MSDQPGRTPSPSDCAGCGHIAEHHDQRRSVPDPRRPFGDYKVIWACGWTGCGCPNFVTAPASTVLSQEGEL